MKCSVYNIIYRNDSTVKGMLEEDLLFLKTGFIAFRDQAGRFWYFHKKAGIIVPEHQEYLDRTYGRRDILPRVKKVRIGEDECDSSLPTEEWARDFFIGLSKISACAHWRVESRIWKILSSSDTVYDAPVRLIRPEDYLDRVSILRCAYVKEGITNRRNFTSFADWEYITSYEMTSDGTVALIQADLNQEEISGESGPDSSAEASTQESPRTLEQRQESSAGEQAVYPTQERSQTSTTEALSKEETCGAAPEQGGVLGGVSAQRDAAGATQEQISLSAMPSQESPKNIESKQESAFADGLSQGELSDAAPEQGSASVEKPSQGELSDAASGQGSASVEKPSQGELSDAVSGQGSASVEKPSQGELSNVSSERESAPVEKPSQTEMLNRTPAQGNAFEEKPSQGELSNVSSERESAPVEKPSQTEMLNRTPAQGNAFEEKPSQEELSNAASGQGNASMEKPTQEELSNAASEQVIVSGEGTGEAQKQESFSEAVSSQDNGLNTPQMQETSPGEALSQENSSGAVCGREIPSGETTYQEDTPRAALSENALSHAAEAGKQKKKAAADVRELLDCDKRRCRLESYEENMLYDIKRGHWELFECEDIAEVPEKGKMIPRDPRKDIKTGVVGIDFGTKSTVVVRQDDTNAIIPIRIGAEVLSAELRENDYENPTIIECTNLDKFIKKYYEQEGRPETCCEDFFVSYDANNNYRTCPPNEFYAYYAELKQWANFEKDNVVVWDKQKHEYRFGAEGSESGKIINPIELYAYYIGMYINNMRNGIYMKYLMSFPVGYSKETRQLIVASFEKGIRKSLPQCVLEDEECMKDFSVQLGISEPAAYAVTALEMSDLEPKDENDQYRYGIFDFGGGTADFGFGIWRGASEEEYEVEGYDYVLECFGADSDVTLGGEKILELLAYAVFKKNKELARRNRITCSLPYGEQAFLGSEILISNSQIAQRNMSILKEELRPLWHQEENWEKKYRHETERSNHEEGGFGYEEYIEPSMYDMDGNKLSDCRFAVDTEELISLIKARIQKGIDAFFKCMSKAFQREDRLAGSDGQMHIFLAGNSSKSVFVRELFEKTIQEYSSRLEVPCIKLMEALNGENRDEYVPNAKTSVAYGLIKSREGSSIKVEKNFETDAEEQTRFKFYLGRERRRHFDCRLSPVETEYGSWIRFQGAAIRTVRIYYTTNPTADVREEPPVIDNIPYKEIAIEPQKDAFVFIRACEPTAIEYTVAVAEERIEEKDICRIDFGM